MFRSVLLSLAMLTITVQPLSAACIDQALPELHRGTRLTILQTDGTTTSATFLRAEGDPLRLVVEQGSGHRERTAQRLELPAAGIRRLDAPGRSTSDPKWSFIGGLGGFYLGMLVARLLAKERVIPPDPAADSRIGQAAADPPVRTERDIKTGEGAVLGWGVGFLLGRILSTKAGPARTWSCVESRPEVRPDSAQVPIR
jgi:hypothetical protein